MIDKLAIAQALFGRERAEINRTVNIGQTRTYTAVAGSDSENGVVQLKPFGEFITEDDSELIEVDTIPSVKEGDIVYVTLYGDSVGKQIIVSGVAGSGDRQEQYTARVEENAGANYVEMQGKYSELTESIEDVSGYVDEVHTQLIDYTEYVDGYIRMDAGVIELGRDSSPTRQLMNNEGSSIVNVASGDSILLAQFGENALLPSLETNYIRMGDMIIVKRQASDGTHITFKGV